MAPMWIGSGFFCWITTWAPPQAARPAARAAATVAAATARRLIVRLTRVLCPTMKLHHGSPESRRLHPGPCEPTRAGRRERAAARGEGAAARRHAREREEDGAHGRTRTCDLRFRRRTAAIPRGCRESHSSLVNHAQVQGLCEPPFRSGERPSHSNMACHRPSPRTPVSYTHLTLPT